MAEKTEISITNNNGVMDKISIMHMIYVVRGKQVMLDSDLARLYHVETKVFNQAVKRNIARFPENFRFQLTQEEFDSLRSQIVTSNENSRGGRRYLPAVFTEAGIAVLFERISAVELRQLEYQKQTDEGFEQVFDYIADHEESNQKVFFDGQIYDAFSLIISLIQKAEKSIILIDGYVDVDTLNLLTKKKPEINVTIYTKKKTKLSAKDIHNFNVQYPTIRVEYTERFHDRFLILDEVTAYHIGASIKDAGRKCFGITLIQDKALVEEILFRLDS